MFERFTERARRCIFFAHRSAAEYSSQTIETEHLLLGILREDAKVIPHFLPSKMNEDIRAEVEGRLAVKANIATAVEIPLSAQCKRILAFATEEAEVCFHRHVEIGHLLVGMLREEEAAAGQILKATGMNVEAVRQHLRETWPDR